MRHFPSCHSPLWRRFVDTGDKRKLHSERVIAGGFFVCLSGPRSKEDYYIHAKVKKKRKEKNSRVCVVDMKE
jgi:hypothetical protein